MMCETIDRIYSIHIYYNNLDSLIPETVKLQFDRYKIAHFGSSLKFSFEIPNLRVNYTLETMKRLTSMKIKLSYMFDIHLVSNKI